MPWKNASVWQNTERCSARLSSTTFSSSSDVPLLRPTAAKMLSRTSQVSDTDSRGADSNPADGTRKTVKLLFASRCYNVDLCKNPKHVVSQSSRLLLDRTWRANNLFYFCFIDNHTLMFSGAAPPTCDLCVKHIMLRGRQPNISK